jgi:hypothetical protein
MFSPLRTEISLTLQLLSGLQIRNGVPYINVGILVCSQHSLYNLYSSVKIEWYAVGQLVETLLCKPQVRTFDYRWVHRSDLIFPSDILPCVRLSLYQQYQEYVLGRAGGRCIWLTTLPPSRADCLEILGCPNSCNRRGTSSSVQGLLYLFVRTEDVTDLLRVGEKMSHMKFIE